MILSVSRRTDIPNYYSEWFMNRIREGYLYVRNPMNAHQISRIDLSPDLVYCIVFWTKNPELMLSRLEELDANIVMPIIVWKVFYRTINNTTFILHCYVAE